MSDMKESKETASILISGWLWLIKIYIYRPGKTEWRPLGRLQMPRHSAVLQMLRVLMNLLVAARPRSISLFC